MTDYRVRVQLDRVHRETTQRADHAKAEESYDSEESGRPTRELQRTLGNQAVQRLAEEGAIQRAATVRPPDDTAEREADRVADAVVGGDRPGGIRTATRGSKGESAGPARESAESGTAKGDAGSGYDASAAVDAVQSGGRPLPGGVREEFEGRFGRDFSDVRVHTSQEADRAAQSIDAEAYTTGTDVAFREGAYDTDSESGRKLLAHELTHVVQQGGADERAQGTDTDRELQRQASGTGTGGTGGMSVPSQESTGEGERPMGGYTTTGTGGVGGMSAIAGGLSGESVENQPWHETGNLKGDPPVRDREEPPNKHVVEDEAVYGNRLGIAEQFYARQQERTSEMTDSQGNVTDYKYWFARLYQEVTRNEIEHAENANYYYPSFVLASVNYFEQIYEDNLQAFEEAGKEAERHWQTAFERAAKSKEQAEQSGLMINEYVDAIMSAMVESVKAHIRFDLPRAEAWVFNQYYSGFENASIDDFRPDFFAMSNVFKNAADFMNQHIFDKTWVPANQAPPTLEQFMMEQYGLNLAGERADTWKRAKLLVEGGTAGAGPYGTGEGEMTGSATRGEDGAGVRTLGGGMGADMDRAAEGFSPEEAAEVVANTTREELARYDPVGRTRILASLIDDYNGSLIVKLLRASVGSGLVDVVSGAEAHSVLSATSGGSFETAKTLLEEHYWPAVDHHTALFAIKQCLDGTTNNWQETLVLDILETRDDDRELIESLGDAPQYSDYEGENDFDRGLSVLEYFFDGWQDTELEERYGDSSQSWF